MAQEYRESKTDIPEAREWMAVARQCRYFEGLTDTELEMVRNISSTDTFAVEETVATAGGRRVAAYLIAEGEVDVVFRGDEEEVPLGKFMVGDVVAPASLGAVPPVTGFLYRARTEVKAYRIEGDDFRRLCDRTPRIGYVVMSALVGQANRRIYQVHRALQEAMAKEEAVEVRQAVRAVIQRSEEVA